LTWTLVEGLVSFPTHAVTHLRDTTDLLKEYAPERLLHGCSRPGGRL
jgi:hypothetical protein